jgi:SWI/SNF-related matrix-associated actin-dependent regulator of chromatin subfamily A member 5
MIHKAKTGIADDELAEQVGDDTALVAQAPMLRNFEGEVHVKKKKVVESLLMEGKRARQSRVVEIDGFPVLISTIEDEQEVESEDESQFSKREKAKLDATAWHHQNICFSCKKGPHADRLWESCMDCPRVYHHDCLGVSINNYLSAPRCPQHKCCHEDTDDKGRVVDRCMASSSASGGALFRCDSCPKAFCWSHLPKNDDWHSK